MICGFDYGTSNCALGIVENDVPKLLALEGKHTFLPSTLYALDRSLISEFVARNMRNEHERSDFVAARTNTLRQAQRFRQQEGLDSDDTSLYFGRSAFSEYYQWPEEGYFVKSPKSFLGSRGLRQEHIHFFEDVVTVMMQNIKQKAENQLQQPLTHTVIGRPVNFQGVNAEESNRQAIEILTLAAKRAGFQHVEFLYEPIAAGMDFERNLQQNQTVLVVDIGGGTTDCAMVRMGPDYRHKQDRSADFLAHTGERVGGNDLDIRLAGKGLMPLFGMDSLLKSGLPMPTQIFWDAVTTNDVTAQARFSSLPTQVQLDELRLDARQPMLIDRFIQLREEKQNFHLVRNAEETKIALSEQDTVNADLSYIEAGLSATLTRENLTSAIQPPLQKMLQLMEAAIKEAGEQPDLIYMTGGSAKSPIVRQAIAERIGQIKLLDGDHFGSVAAGLTTWSQRLFQ